MIEIENGPYRAAIAPGAGGCVMRLQYNGRDILRRAPSLEAVKADPRESACYPCVPWFGRLFGGLDFDGRHYNFTPTLPVCDPEHALHGHGWMSNWEIARQEQNRLDCRFDYQPKEAAFPFPFRAEQSFLLNNSFEISLLVNNTGATPMPAGLGLHPFFPNGQDTALNTVDHRGPIPSEETDYTLTGWNGNAEIFHNSMRLELHSTARLVHFFSPKNADFFCLEPITHRPGEFGRDIIAPGESINLKMLLRVIE